MNDLLIGFLGAVLATNQPAALSNLVHRQTGLAIPVANSSSPTMDPEYRELLLLDEAALLEIDGWIKESHTAEPEPSPVEKALLQKRVQDRIDQVRQAYDTYLERHPQNAQARLAYGSFLGETVDEDAAAEQYKRVIELDPSLPAAWNNLANYYGHNGPVIKSFEYYAKAIELNPHEPVYHHNLATTVFMFRKDARAYFNITEEEVFDKAMKLYHKSLELDPDNFILATDVARTYYGVKPAKTGDEAIDREAERALAKKMLAAWEYAMKLARDDTERQGILVHYARAHMLLGNYNQARAHLNSITNALYGDLKKRVLDKIEREDPATTRRTPPN